MDRVVVFFGSLEAVEHLPKNDIRSGPLLGDICFTIFIDVPLIYVANLFL
jgi:hypothetical protein